MIISKTSVITISSLVLLCIASFCYLYKFPKEINVNRTAVSFIENDASSVTDTTIKVNGTLYRPVFRQHYFVGKVTIDGYDFTENDSTFNIYITIRKNGINMGALNYQNQHKPFDFTQQSLMYFDDDFTNINICASTKWWGSDENGKSLYIVTESNYEQAVDIQKAMREKFGKGFVPHE